MDRKYKAAHTVNVYANQTAKDAGAPLATVQRVPWQVAGFASYLYNSTIYEGYIDPLHPEADACIILEP